MEIQLDQEVLTAIENYRLPRYNEIPTVGLYLNQVAKYINTYLEPLGDMSITESMISNYVKKHLIANPEKKQYNREQLAYLLFIAVAKSVLSLDNIQILLNLQRETYESQVAYDYFCNEFEQILLNVFGIGEFPSITDPAITADSKANDAKLLFRSIIITVAHKIYLDQRFHSLSPTDSEKKSNF